MDQLVSGRLAKLSLNSSDPTCMETGTVNELLLASFEEMVIVSVKVPVPVLTVEGLTVIVAGAVPDVALRPSQLVVSLAVQLSEPVPAFAT